ncbi:hypothetical protein [Methylocella sp.]|uniref:hypothetical protein n=1 Tax=Methylocella sp. TaxID=1978226 RepID=UPI003C2077BD
MKKYALLMVLALGATPAMADGGGNPRQNCCNGLPTWSQLQAALKQAVAVGPNAATGNGGLGFNMWGTIVAKDGTVCAVAFSGNTYTDQWLASRVISAQKANTANGLSLGNTSPPSASVFPTGLALSTANPPSSRAAACTGSSSATQSIRPTLTFNRMASPMTPAPTAWRMIPWWGVRSAA